jgi:hypothetical protein
MPLTRLGCPQDVGRSPPAVETAGAIAHKNRPHDELRSSSHHVTPASSVFLPTTKSRLQISVTHAPYDRDLESRPAIAALWRSGRRLAA